jgi:hypothetical protein
MSLRYLTLTATILAALSAGPAPAQEPSEEDEGRALIEDGARLLFEGLRRELGPVLEGLRDRAEEMEPALRDFAEQMGPALRDLMGKIGDLSAYHPPEVLPNGDIILRRKSPEELEADRVPEGEIEI